MSSVSIADDDTATHFIGRYTYLLAVVVCEIDTLEKGKAREAVLTRSSNITCIRSVYVCTTYTLLALYDSRVSTIIRKYTLVAYV